MGHSEGAAALTSVIKAIVALEHQTILPNIKFNIPNPESTSHVETLFENCAKDYSPVGGGETRCPS
jgi:3-oxoacyl-(acyl-carrier-protein) synthase